MKVLLPVWKRFTIALAIGISVGVFMLSLRSAGWLQAWELVAFDVTTTALANSEHTEDVVLLALTDVDLSRWGWPLPDAQLARLVEASLALDAKSVGVDIYRDVPVGDGREELLEALSDPRVVTISKLSGAEGIAIGAPQGVHSGFADVPLDPDGVARRALLLVNTQSGLEMSFPLMLAMNYVGQDALRPAPGMPGVLAFGTVAVPALTEIIGPYRTIDTSGYQIITRHRHTLPIAPRVTARDVLSGQAQLQGKVVIIALTSHSVKDYFSTPLNRRTAADFAFGADVHAAIAQQLIDHTQRNLPPFRALPNAIEGALILVAACAGAVAGMLLTGTIATLVVGVGGAFILAILLSAAHGLAILMPTVPTTLAWLTAFALAFATIAAIARSQRRILANIFSAHMSDALASDIWRQRKQLLAGQKPVSQRLFVTALMADIEGSTRIAKMMETQAFMDWVSRLLDTLGSIAQAHGGFVEKFTGDGILVVFGAPVPSRTLEEQRRDAQAAVACGQAMRQAALDLSTAEAKDRGYGLRIGLNSGEVIAGTLGPSGALRYNVMGDTVNIAARVEGWSKRLDPDETGARPICLTESTAELVVKDHLCALKQFLLHDDGRTQIPIFVMK